MSLLGLSRRLGASVPKPAGMLAASLSSRAVSTSLFKASVTLERSSYKAPMTVANWRVSSKRHKQQPKTVRGMLDDDGVLRAPPVLTKEELAAEKAIVRASRPVRTVFPMRKSYLRGKYRELFDSAQLMIVLHALDSSSFNDLKVDVAAHFESAHLCTGLIAIDDKPYKTMTNLLRSTSRVLYVTDSAKIIPALGALQRSLKKFPNLLFLGGMVQGTTSTSFDLEELLQFSSIEQIKGSVIPYLNAPAQIIPALQAPSMSLIRLLEHHNKVQGEASAAPA